MGEGERGVGRLGRTSGETGKPKALQGILIHS